MQNLPGHGNDTIDPYPLIPGEANKILIVNNDIFEELRVQYKAFSHGLRGRPAKRSSNLGETRWHSLRQKMPSVKKTHFLPYEPSPAIVVNECDYRRWCRVIEWFKEFGPDAEKFERTAFIPIKMDT